MVKHMNVQTSGTVPHGRRWQFQMDIMKLVARSPGSAFVAHAAARWPDCSLWRILCCQGFCFEVWEGWVESKSGQEPS